ncbi:MAG TPA: conjugal transfer protein TraJ [Candidatus Macondimonas sp.]|nr:conjugal transfer protein TraJ [Candidatus Macondimonas sp.]
MEEGAKKRRGGRPRGQRIDVWVTPQEYAAIADKARQTGLSHSAYMRAMALNTPVRSIVDLGAVDHLVRVHGDLGRVAGLLKLWLAERRGIGAHPVDVEAMMKDFRSLQREMLELMGRIVFDRPHSS